MSLIRGIVPMVVAGVTVSPAMATNVFWVIDGTNPDPNTVANALIVDGEGDDWFGAVLKIDLTQGSIYNEPLFGATGPGGTGDRTQATLWPFVPALKWDSAVGIPYDGTTSVLITGAGDLGGGPMNLGGTGVDAASLTWFNAGQDDIHAVQIANITMTDDAVGTWELLVTFERSPLVQIGGTINAGAIPVPEPATLAMMGFGGLLALRRR